MNNLLTRTITGAVFVIVIIGGVIWNQWSFLLLFLLINAFTLNEFYLIFKADIKPPIRYYSILLGSYIYLTPSLIFLDLLPAKCSFIIIPLIPVLFLLELFLNEQFSIKNVGFALLGIIYISLPFTILGYLATNPGSYSYKLILVLLIFTWINDIFAYLTGKFFGRRKLFTRLSPLKTWEGVFGGMLVTVLSSFAIGYFFKDFSQITWVVLSLIVSISATFGDLT